MCAPVVIGGGPALHHQILSAGGGHITQLVAAIAQHRSLDLSRMWVPCFSGHWWVTPSCAFEACANCAGTAAAVRKQNCSRFSLWVNGAVLLEFHHMWVGSVAEPARGVKWCSTQMTTAGACIGCVGLVWDVFLHTGHWRGDLFPRVARLGPLGTLGALEGVGGDAALDGTCLPRPGEYLSNSLHRTYVCHILRQTDISETDRHIPWHHVMSCVVCINKSTNQTFTSLLDQAVVSCIGCLIRSMQCH